MKKFFADTNIFLRFFLGDNKIQFEKAEDYIDNAQKGKISIYVISEVIFEIEHVLRSFYKMGRAEISKNLSAIAKMPYLDVEDATIWIRACATYSTSNIDLIDIFLYLKAERVGAKILSFDKDFRRLQKLL